MQTNDKTPPFVHLRVRSSYSLGEGLSTPAEICAYAHRSGYRSVALTDTNHTYGFLEFHREARRLGLKPIYGVVMRHEETVSQGESRHALTALALSGEGFRNLVSLASLSLCAVEEGSALDRPVLESHAQGLAILIDPEESEVAHLLLSGDRAAAKRSLEVFKELFGDHLFVEVRHVEDPQRRRRSMELQEGLRALAADIGIRPVLTEDVRFVGQPKSGVLGLLNETPHPRPEGDFFSLDAADSERGMKLPAEMAKLREVYQEAYDNALVIERMVSGDLLSDKRLDEGEPDARSELWRSGEPASTFDRRVIRRLELHFHHLLAEEMARVREVLRSEVDQIRGTGLERTFLLYQEIASQFRKAGVSTGPATGLSVQSLCAYLLGITAFNPYRFDESFRPMLDPVSGRSGVLEVQLGSDEKEEAMRCLRELFEPHCVAYVPAVEHITPARALKTAARSLEMDEEQLAEVFKIAAQHPGYSIKSLCEEEEKLGKLYRRSVLVREVLSKAALIEGLPSGFIRSKRSAIISPRPIREFMGYTVDKDSGDLFVQATRDAFPIGGIYRIDFTPLAALSVCVRTERELGKRRVRVRAWDSLPVDERSVWERMQNEKATGIYLLESAHIQRHFATFSPQSIEELTHFLSLMRMRIEEKGFSARLEDFRSGAVSDFDYLPGLAPVLRSTRGMILYEEQLRDLLSLLTGTDPAEAYRMLERFKERDPAHLSALRKEYMGRTADQDLPMEAANEWFEKFLYYSKRTVSRQRVLADALVVFKSFYLRHYHEIPFFLSLLNTHWDNEAKVKVYLAYLHDIDALLPIDINKSELYFALEDGKIRMGLYMLDGVSYASLLRILKARGRRKFRSLEAFIQRTKRHGITLDEVGQLVLVGAFNFTGASRTNLLNALPELYENPSAGSTRALKDQMELPLPLPAPSKRATPMDGDHLLEHLMSAKWGSPVGLASGGDYRLLSSLEEFYSQPSASSVEIAGQVSNLQRLKTKSGKTLGFFVLLDFSAVVHVFVPWDRYGLFSEILEEGRQVVVRGQVSFQDDKRVCQAKEIRAFVAGEPAHEEDPGTSPPEGGS